MLSATLTRETALEELAFMTEVLTGKLTLESFDWQWACFARYCQMQTDRAARSGLADVADIMQATTNRVKRKATKATKGAASHG